MVYTRRFLEARKIVAHRKLREHASWDRFSEWTARVQGGGTWDTEGVPRGQKVKLRWQNNGGAALGGMIHPNVTKGTMQLAQMYAHTSNLNIPGQDSGMGPAVLLQDNGAGVAPDGYYMAWRYTGGNSVVELHEVKTAGTVDTILASMNTVVLTGDLVSIWMQEVIVPTFHLIFTIVNSVPSAGKGGGHIGQVASTGTYQGVYGMGYGPAKQYSSIWYANPGDLPF